MRCVYRSQEEDFPGAIQLCLECQKAASTYKHYHCIRSCSVAAADVVETLYTHLSSCGMLACCKFSLFCLCYLVTSFQQPGYLADLISPYSQSRSLRSSTQKFLSVPPHNLDTAAPILWNSHPLNCRTAPSVNTFKIRLKTFLFASA